MPIDLAENVLHLYLKTNRATAPCSKLGESGCGIQKDERRAGLSAIEMVLNLWVMTLLVCPYLQ